MHHPLIKHFAIILATLFTLTVSPAVAVEDQPYASDAIIRVEGRGHAHGVGLCMAGVMFRARANQSYKNIIPAYLTGTKVVKIAKPPKTLRIGLGSHASFYAAEAVSKSGCGTYAIRSGKEIIHRGVKGDSIKVSYYPAPKSYKLVVTGLDGSVTNLESTYAYVRLVPLTPPAGSIPTVFKYTSNARRYRGTIEFRYSAKKGRMFVINVLPLETYLKGIAEEPDTWPAEGLRVETVGCRSYATYRYYTPKQEHADSGFQLCDGPHCQFYTGYGREVNQPHVAEAVDATRGEVVTYGGQPVIVPFFSTCGGKTENVEAVWGATPKPYLRGVTCGWCNNAKRAHWSMTYTYAALNDRLTAESSMNPPGNLLSFRVTSRGYSPRVAKMNIIGTAGIKRVWGVWFHEKLNWDSSWFTIYMPARITSTAWTQSPVVPIPGEVTSAAEPATLSFSISAPGTVLVSIDDIGGNRKKTYEPVVKRQRGVLTYVWDARDDEGLFVEPSSYDLTIEVRGSRGEKNYYRGSVTVD